jgi:hypothetical protein
MCRAKLLTVIVANDDAEWALLEPLHQLLYGNSRIAKLFDGAAEFWHKVDANFAIEEVTVKFLLVVAVENDGAEALLALTSEVVDGNCVAGGAAGVEHIPEEYGEERVGDAIIHSFAHWRKLRVDISDEGELCHILNLPQPRGFWEKLVPVHEMASV